MAQTSTPDRSHHSARVQWAEHCIAIASILALERGAFDYGDVVGERVRGEWRLARRAALCSNGNPWNG